MTQTIVALGVVSYPRPSQLLILLATMKKCERGILFLSCEDEPD